MNRSKPTKINLLLSKWPQGTVATARWLRSQGVAPDLLYGYRSTGWVRSLGRGASVRVGDTVRWQGALYALQEQLGLSIHPGGKTALALHGRAHYLPLGRESVMLFGSTGERVPDWFREHDWSAEVRIITTTMFPCGSKTGLVRRNEGRFEITVSSAERAIMEVLYCVPDTETFGEAKLLFEGLLDLRPEVVQQLLEQCASVKVKRLFMILAEHFDYPWLFKLDTARVNFGKGKRMAAKGGVFDKRYFITVPKEWKETERA